MWSSHHYEKHGLDQGLPEDLIYTAISQTENVFDVCSDLPSILSLKHLSVRASVSYKILQDQVSRVGPLYTKFSIKKRSGGRRFIFIPDPDLLRTQRWINEFILKPLPVHRASCAFTKGSSIGKCAQHHCGSKWLIKFDIADFFESITEIQVYRVFRKAGYQPLVSFQLARICTIPTPYNSPRKRHKNWLVRKRNNVISTYEQHVLGYLPQGGATSPLISNLVMRDLDDKLHKLSRKFRLVYTRYSDDITFSTKSKGFDRSQAGCLISEVYELLNKAGYKPQYRKTKVIPPSARKIVLGLNVDGEFPRLQKEYKDNIRLQFYYINKVGLNEHVLNRGFDTVWGYKSHLKGMIDYAKSIEPKYAEKILHEFNSIEWPV